MSSIIDPAVLLDPGQPSPTIPSGTAMKERIASESLKAAEDFAASKVRSCGARGSQVFVTFTEDVGKARAEDPRHYLVMINGTTHLLAPNSIAYDRASRTVTFKRLPIHPGDSVAITALGLWDHPEHIPTQSVTCRTCLLKPAQSKWFSLVMLVAFILVVLVGLMVIV